MTEQTTRASAADLENRTAFLVQLQALLVQAKHVTGGEQRGGLRKIQQGLEAWLKEVGGEVGVPRPSLFSANTETSVEACSNTSSKNNNNNNNDNDSGGHGHDNCNGDFNNICADSVSTPHGEPHATLSAHGDELSSFTVDTCNSACGAVSSGLAENSSTFSSSFKNRNLEDIAEFLQLFFASGIQEIVKLRSIGRNVARVVIVRSFSIISCALEEMLREIYCLDFETAESNFKPRAEVNDCLLVSFFVRIAHDIRISTNAIMKCLRLLTVHTDLLSTRFAAQVCVDILKQLRQCVSILVQQLLRGEVRRLYISKNVGAESNLNLQDETMAQQMAEERINELRHIMGPSLLTSIEYIMTLVSPTVQYLMSVLSFKDSGGSNEEMTLRNDVSANLFALAQWVASTSWPKRRKQKLVLTETVVNESEKDIFLGQSFNAGTAQFVRMSDIDSIAAMNPLWSQYAHFVVESLFPVAFSPEYISCVAQHCGDQNDGQLLALRLLTNVIKKLTETSITELRYVLKRTKWKKRIAVGILHSIVSPQAAVLEAALDALHRIVVTCVESLGSEIGFVYTSCVFGLLESDSTPPVMRRLLSKHVISTFFGSSVAPGQPSLLLRLYEHFDLNIRWHQLNVVQQAVATLSKAVRCAALEDFADENLAEEDETQDPTVLQRSTPFLALQGLSLAVRQLAMHTPHDYQIATELKNLPNMPNREKKMEEQRIVDIINGSPLKGFKKLFDITDEEMNPSECKKAAMENNWAHQHIPSPTSAEAEAKVRLIAHYLMNTPSLNPESAAEFLSRPAVLPLQVCRVFMKELSLAGKGLVEGLKELFSIVQLPKEGQCIERLLEFFCSAYFEANSVPGVDCEVFPFESENACFIVGVAVLMLNTNLYNPHVSSVKMKASSFHAQLQGCNEGKDFSERFTKSIFDDINAQSLSSIKGFWSAGINSGVRYATVPFPGKMDSIFLTSEERRELAFGAVRQRLVNETRELIYRCSKIEQETVEKTPLFWLSVTRDLFLNTWPSLCAVFGVALHGTRLPEEALALCLMGLRSSFIVAAAFGLHTESSVSQLALLRMASLEPMRDDCHKSILEVASSLHGFFLSAQCWMQVVNLLISVRKSPKKPLVVEAESVYNRIEEFTRRSCARSQTKANSDDVLPSFKGVVQEMLKGIVAVVQDTSIDGATLSAAFYVLRRVLGYSLISHESQQTMETVTNFINVRDFSHVVLPALVDVTKSRSGKSDECLRLVVEFVVDILYAIWDSCVCNFSDHSVFLQAELTECYSFFQKCHERCEASAEVLLHVLQGAKELIARTLRGVGAVFIDGAEVPLHKLHTVAYIWQQLLQPVARALSEKDSVGTETCGIAVHVLRKLVVLCCGAAGEGQAMIAAHKNIRNILLILLSNVAYIGCMCSDVDSSQLCLSQLSTICMTVMSCKDDVISCANDLHCHNPQDEHVLLNNNNNNNTGQNETSLLRDLVESILHKADAFAFHLLDRISLLLLCQTQQIRTEVISVFRLLVVKLGSSHLQHLAARFSTAVLEASLGYATLGYKPSMVNLSYESYALFDLQVPPTMRICSTTSFCATLPDVLKFMSNDLLSASSVEHVTSIVSVVMKHCTVPLAVSPRSSFQMRTTAVRALMQCASLCVTRQGLNSCAAALCLKIIIECVSLVLLTLRIPVTLIVPECSHYAGRQWVEKRSAALAEYAVEGLDAVEALCAADASKVSGICCGSACVPQAKSNANVEPVESDRMARCSRSPVYGDTVTDDRLTEYCTLMAQLLSPLPKVLSAALKQSNTAKKEDECATPQPCDDCVLWAPPFADRRVLAELVLEATGTFFAVLWRVSHVAEMETFVAKSAQQGCDAPPMCKSHALLPHVAIRGGLNSFLELSLWMNITDLRGIFLEILSVTATLQKVTLSTREAQKALEGETENIAIQRLSPLEQQHINSCNMGMYQELSAVIAHWVKTIVQQTDATASDFSSAQREELRNVAGGSDIFSAITRLLTPRAGSVILPIREYLLWYILPFQKSEGVLEAAESDIFAVASKGGEM